MTIKADFSEEMELHGFPFDIQPLHIELTSTRKCKTVILSFEDKERPCSMSPNALESQEFELHSPQIVSYDMRWKDKDKPLLIVGSPMYAKCSAMMNLNLPTTTPESTARRMHEARGHFISCVKICKHQVREGRYCLHQHPMGAKSWQQPGIKAMRNQ